jgi:hypothetical protein
MVILAFGLVYLFWGSTYLAIDIAVQTTSPALSSAIVIVLDQDAGYVPPPGARFYIRRGKSPCLQLWACCF